MSKTWIWVVCLAIAGGPVAVAEEKTEAARPRKNLIPLKVQLVFARYQGEKKVASLPYTLWVNAEDRGVHLRQGVKVPVPGKDGQGFQYMNVGMNIDCSAESLDDGRFRVSATVDQSSIFPLDPDKKTAGLGPMNGAPLVGSFYSEFNIIVRDGGSAQYTTVTDPVTGEVLKIDLMLSVLK